MKTAEKHITIKDIMVVLLSLMISAALIAINVRCTYNILAENAVSVSCNLENKITTESEE
jgi:hypothetical protein